MKEGLEGRRDRIYLFHLKGRTASILPPMHPSWVHEFYEEGTLPWFFKAEEYSVFTFSIL